MKRLIIDGVVCPIVGREPELPTFNVKRLESIDAWREEADIDLRVASVDMTDALFQDGANIYRRERFNLSYHPAQIEVDGVTLFEGLAILLGVDIDHRGTTYRVRIRSGGAEWAEMAATTKLSQMDIDYRGVMSLSGIAESWSDDSLVRFLPLWRDSYPEPAMTGLFVEQRTLMPHNYHPFIAVLPIIESLVERAGYKLESNFMRSEKFSRLMMSGAWPKVESATAQATMGFKAYRLKTTTATAGEDGRVYVWEPAMASNVGAIVDTINPAALTDDGVMVGDAYTNGGCFSFEEGRPIFRPKRDISVAFDYHLRFTTDYRIASSKFLQGFDRVNIGTGCEVELKLNNPYIDHRHTVYPQIEYNLYIFDFDPEMDYTLQGYGRITEAVTTVTFPKGVGSSVMLFQSEKGSNALSPYSGDWALYDGYVEPIGRRTVEIDVRSSYERYTPTSPKRFNDIFFGGATEGQTLTLHSGCYVTPIFGGVAGYGESVVWKDITHHDISLTTLLQALQQMFNLRIYSHAPSKRLFIEPYDDFYSGTIVDWRARQVDDGVVLDEGATQSYATTTLKYQAGDGVISRLKEQLGSEPGSWSHHNPGYAAKYAEHTIINSLFAPTASIRDFAPSAPSAEVLTAGNRDSLYDEGLTPRVVLYTGMVELPEGEWWASPVVRSAYPHAAFHNIELGESLSFSDGDGLEGLHRYYDTELKEWAEREVVELTLHIDADEYRALFDPSSSGATIRSLFRLVVGGQSSLFRLLSVEAYDTEHHTARCRFLRTFND
ncbi:MAG: hypothetical protein J6R90_06390 [Alistipes sp.]|nr:hypothetical protein [Alistipes sp.]